DFDEFTHDNNDSILKCIADDLRNCLPLETMLSSERLALQKIQQQPEPTVHVDAFLYDEDSIDSLCEEGKMSRNYCVVCGSYQTAPLVLVLLAWSDWGRRQQQVQVGPALSTGASSGYCPDRPSGAGGGRKTHRGDEGRQPLLTATNSAKQSGLALGTSSGCERALRQQRV
ncbi:hypothetical protein MDA_GLEAN10008315, partial [Myotis davidii]